MPVFHPLSLCSFVLLTNPLYLPSSSFLPPISSPSSLFNFPLSLFTFLLPSLPPSLLTFHHASLLSYHPLYFSSSLYTFLPHYSPSLPPSVPSSLPLYLPPPSVPSSLPLHLPSSLPFYFPPSLLTSLPPSISTHLPPFLFTFLPPFLPFSLHLYSPSSLPLYLPSPFSTFLPPFITSSFPLCLPYPLYTFLPLYSPSFPLSVPSFIPLYLLPPSVYSSLSISSLPRHLSPSLAIFPPPSPSFFPPL